MVCTVLAPNKGIGGVGEKKYEGNGEKQIRITNTTVCKYMFWPLHIFQYICKF